MINKLLALFSIGSSVANVTLLQRFLEGVVSIIILTIISAMMTAILLACGFYAGYLALVSNGLTAGAALLTIIVVVFLLASLLASLTILHIKHLREIPRHALPHGLPSLPYIGNIASAFLEGLKSSPSKPKN